MKKALYFLVAVVVLGLVFSACSKDDGPAPKPDTDPTPENRAPEAFSLTSPEHGAETEALRPEFSWQAATDPDGDAVAYDLLLGKGAGLTPDSLMARGILETTYTPEQDLPATGEYQWQVIAKDDKGGMIASGVFAFTVARPVRLKDAQKVDVANAFIGREKHAAVVFDDRMFILGGFGNGQNLNDSPSSTDGKDWVEGGSQSNNRYTARGYHRASVFKDAIYITGGLADSFESDVWISTDGSIWTPLEQDQEKPYVSRAEHTFTVHGEKLWLIGGSNGGGVLADIWSSSDGQQWELEVEEAPFGKRNFHQTVSFKDKLWVIGGFENFQPKNDVWSSTDGAVWEQVTPDAPFSPRANHQVLVFDEKIWLIGSGTENDIWYSEDGVNWIEATPENSFEPKNEFAALFYQGTIWILGGSGTNEVWRIDIEN